MRKEENSPAAPPSAAPEVAAESVFQGSRRELGRQHGRTFAGPVRRELDLALAACGRLFALDEAQLLASSKRFVPWIRRHLPLYLSEVEGLAEGAGISFEAALFLAVSDGLRPNPRSECTAFYCGSKSTADGAIYLGQTKDTPPREGRYFVMRWIYDDGPEMLLLNYAGWLANIGLTSRGIGLCGNALYVKEPRDDCRPFSLLKRGILESENVSQALQFVEAGDWQDGCLTFADQGGTGVFAELIHGKAHCQTLTDGAGAHANTILTPECAHLDTSEKNSPCSRNRQKTADHFLQESAGKLTDKSLHALMADHSGRPQSICRHADSDQAVRTTAAILANLSEGWLDVAIGNPCEAGFRRYQLRA